MNNPIASALGIQSQGMQPQPQMSPQMANLSQFISQFNQFRQGFSGDARQNVMNLMSSGRVSQAQFDSFAQTATQLRNMLGSMGII